MQSGLIVDPKLFIRKATDESYPANTGANERRLYSQARRKIASYILFRRCQVEQDRRTKPTRVNRL